MQRGCSTLLILIALIREIGKCHSRSKKTIYPTKIGCVESILQDSTVLAMKAAQFSVDKCSTVCVKRGTYQPFMAIKVAKDSRRTRPIYECYCTYGVLENKEKLAVCHQCVPKQMKKYECGSKKTFTFYQTQANRCQSMGQTICHAKNTEKCTVFTNDTRNYVCRCKAGFSGRSCSEALDGCTRKVSPHVPAGRDACGSHGKCVADRKRPIYYCFCELGWTDSQLNQYQDCQKRIPLCNHKVCLHGSCISSRNEMKSLCVCDQGFEGPSCENRSSTWGQWKDWSPCKPSCGHVRYKLRKRTCPAGESCVGSPSITVECSINECQIPGIWSIWDPWSGCSSTCGNGTQIRHRYCFYPIKNVWDTVGEKCRGQSVQREPCFVKECAILMLDKMRHDYKKVFSNRKALAVMSLCLLVSLGTCAISSAVITYVRLRRRWFRRVDLSGSDHEKLQVLLGGKVQLFGEICEHKSCNTEQRFSELILEENSLYNISPKTIPVNDLAQPIREPSVKVTKAHNSKRAVKRSFPFRKEKPPMKNSAENSQQRKLQEELIAQIQSKQRFRLPENRNDSESLVLHTTKPSKLVDTELKTQYSDSIYRLPKPKSSVPLRLSFKLPNPDSPSRFDLQNKNSPTGKPIRKGPLKPATLIKTSFSSKLPITAKYLQTEKRNSNSKVVPLLPQLKVPKSAIAVQQDPAAAIKLTTQESPINYSLTRQDLPSRPTFLATTPLKIPQKESVLSKNKMPAQLKIAHVTPTPKKFSQTTGPTPMRLPRPETPSPKTFSQPTVPTPLRLPRPETPSPKTLSKPTVPTPLGLPIPENPTSKKILSQPTTQTPLKLATPETPFPKILSQPLRATSLIPSKPEIPSPKTLSHPTVPTPLRIPRAETPTTKKLSQTTVSTPLRFPRAETATTKALPQPTGSTPLGLTRSEDSTSKIPSQPPIKATLKLPKAESPTPEKLSQPTEPAPLRLQKPETTTVKTLPQPTLQTTLRFPSPETPIPKKLPHSTVSSPVKLPGPEIPIPKRFSQPTVRSPLKPPRPKPQFPKNFHSPRY